MDGRGMQIVGIQQNPSQNYQSMMPVMHGYSNMSSMPQNLNSMAFIMNKQNREGMQNSMSNANSNPKQHKMQKDFGYGGQSAQMMPGQMGMQTQNIAYMNRMNNMSNAMPNTMSHAMPNAMSNSMPNTMSNAMPNAMPNSMPNAMSNFNQMPR
jgi:hypothetical protein